MSRRALQHLHQGEDPDTHRGVLPLRCFPRCTTAAQQKKVNQISPSSPRLCLMQVYSHVIQLLTAACYLQATAGIRPSCRSYSGIVTTFYRERCKVYCRRSSGNKITHPILVLWLGQRPV